MNLSNIKFKNYKSFGDYWSTIHNVSSINVLIGRNNSGKSSVLDVIEGLTDANIFHRNSILSTAFLVEMEHTLTEQEIKEVIREANIYIAFQRIMEFTGKVKRYSVDVVKEYSRQDKFIFTYKECEENSEHIGARRFDLELRNYMINPYPRK